MGRRVAPENREERIPLDLAIPQLFLVLVGFPFSVVGTVLITSDRPELGAVLTVSGMWFTGSSIYGIATAGEPPLQAC